MENHDRNEKRLYHTYKEYALSYTNPSNFMGQVW